MIREFKDEYSFLSNFYTSFIILEDGIDKFECPTVEHYFQACKTPNMEEMLGIIGASTPGMAKRLGRKCMLDPNWEKRKDEVMRSALIKKFSDPKLRQKLLDTGDEYLIEGNWWHDNYWGSCYCDKCRDRGQNRLGQLLMEIRYLIREGKLDG